MPQIRAVFGMSTGLPSIDVIVMGVDARGNVASFVSLTLFRYTAAANIFMQKMYVISLLVFVTANMT
jgi:hypothetical protein